MYWCASVPVYWCTGVLVYYYTGVLVYLLSSWVILCCLLPVLVEHVHDHPGQVVPEIFHLEISQQNYQQTLT